MIKYLVASTLSTKYFVSNKLNVDCSNVLTFGSNVNHVFAPAACSVTSYAAMTPHLAEECRVTEAIRDMLLYLSCLLLCSKQDN